MKSPFPGMDPYLENHWGDVHTRLVTYASDQLQPRLPSGLHARVQEQVVLEADEPPAKRGVLYPDVRVLERPRARPRHRGDNGGLATLDVEIATPVIVEELREPRTERWIEIRDAKSRDRVITVIEFLSPTNKTRAGWKLYQHKFEECRKAGVSFVEIDLLRKGPRSHPVSHQTDESYEVRYAYQATVWRGRGDYPTVAYPFGLRDKLKGILIPLRPTDHDVPLDLQALVDLAYRNGNYGDTIDYHQKPSPPLGRADSAWARKLVKVTRKR